MDNQSEISLKFKNSVEGQKKLERYSQTLQKIHSFLNAIDTNKANEVNEISKNIKDTSKDTKGLSSETKTLEKYMNGAFKLAKITAFVGVMKKAYNSMQKFTSVSASFYEGMNLMEVAYHGNTDEAQKFINTLSEMYGLDNKWVMETTSFFKQLSNAMGLSEKTGNKLAETLTRLSIDTASLYDYDPSETVQILQSGLAGQTKPVRRLGGDITQGTLQNFLDANKIDKSVASLSYAEKRLVIVSALLKQTSESSGDWGRTIESVANQQRILAQQTEKVSRAIGNVFLPILAKILPYLNAVAMVLYELISMLAKFVATIFNFDPTQSISSVDKLNTGLDKMDEGFNKANDSAKKLKQGLRGFDKLNNITTPTSTGANVGGGGSGVSSDIEDLFNKSVEKYNKNLDNVKMKATEIRDNIMEWLGFTKLVDEKTGEVSFKFDHITSGTVLGALGIGGSIYLGIIKITSLLDKLGLNPFTGITKMVTSILGLIKKIGAITGLTKSFNSIGLALKGWSQGAWSFSEALEVVLPELGTIAVIVGGIVAILVGVYRTISGIGEILSGDTFVGVLRIIEGIALVVAGVAIILGGWIVAIVAGVIALGALIIEYWDVIKATIVDPVVEWFDTIIQKVKDFISPITNFLAKIGGVISKIFGEIIDWFDDIIEAVVSIFATIIQNVWDIVSGVGEAIITIVSKVIEIGAKILEIIIALGKAAYTYIIKPIVDWLVGLFKWFYNTVIKPIINLFVDIGKWVYNHIISPIWEKIKWLKDQAVSVFKSVGTTVVDFISGTFKSVINGVFATIETNINKFIKLLNNAIGIINKIPDVNIKKVSEIKIPRLKTGMDFVPKDYYPAYLDYGERVLTKEENQAYTKAINSSGSLSGKSSINPTIIVQVGDKEIARQVISDLQDMASSNGKPITIGA